MKKVLLYVWIIGEYVRIDHGKNYTLELQIKSRLHHEFVKLLVINLHLVTDAHKSQCVSFIEDMGKIVLLIKLVTIIS